jgi:glycosyltransferase involved in cell wall biosynthesis
MFLAIVPAYNEESNIGSVVRSLFNHVDKIVVVDDGSSDRTSKFAKDAGAVVLRHRINRGQGAALQTGHDYALQCNADYILHFDGDRQFDVDDIEPAFEKIKAESADILFGSRFLGSHSNIPIFKKYVIFPLARIFHRFFVGANLTDAHIGFRILNRHALQSIHITHDRMAHATEIIEQVKKHNLKYIEFPVQVVYRRYGQGMKGGFAVLKDLLLGKFVKRK